MPFYWTFKKSDDGFLFARKGFLSWGKINYYISIKRKTNPPNGPIHTFKAFPHSKYTYTFSVKSLYEENDKGVGFVKIERVKISQFKRNHIRIKGSSVAFVDENSSSLDRSNPYSSYSKITFKAAEGSSFEDKRK